MATTHALDTRFWKRFFIFAGFFNCVAALPLLIVPQWCALIFVSENAIAPIIYYFLHILFALVLSYGVGYIIASTSPTRHVGIISAGLIGKLLYSFATFQQIFWGYMPIKSLATLAAFGDGIFALFFGYFLLQYYQHERRNA